MIRINGLKFNDMEFHNGEVIFENYNCDCTKIHFL